MVTRLYLWYSMQPKLNCCAVEKVAGAAQTVKLAYGNVALKKERNPSAPWNWEGMNFVIVRLKKQTVIPRRDMKESQCESNSAYRSVQAKAVGVHFND